MKREEFDFILRKGEGYFVEFKEKLDKSFSRELVAFANASGGQIFIGVNDENQAKGIIISNKLKSQIQDYAKNIQPALDISLSEINKVLIVNIPEGVDKPYQCSDGFFLRMGANSQKMSRAQIIDFLQYEGKIKFEEQYNKHFVFDKHYSGIKLNGFLKLSGISKNLDDLSILENLGVLSYAGNIFKINNAGILFFSNKQDTLIEQATITCAVFDGNERIDIINRKDFTEDIITNIDNALQFIKQSLRVSYKMTGDARREEIYEIPLEAIREVVVNAVAHRDYFVTGCHTTIEVFNDRLEIGNPGGLPKGLSIKSFGKKAVRRNPIITNLLQRCNLVENMGTGINKIKKLCANNNVNEPEFIINDFFTVIFKRMVVNEEINEEINGEINEEINKVLTVIKNNPKIKAFPISQKVNKPKKTVDRYLKKLKQLGLIEYRGSNKTGGYYAL